MRDLMATYPSELTNGVDLYMGDPTLSEIADIVKGYKGILNGHTVMSRALLKANAKRMKSIVFLGTGIASYVDPQDGEDLGIAVRYIAGYGDRSIAEHAFALLMSAARGLSQMDREM